MRTILSMAVAIFVVVFLVCPAASLAEPTLELTLSVKKDPGDSYQAIDMNGPWYFGSLGFENLTTVDPEGHTRWGSMNFYTQGLLDLYVSGFDFDSSEGGTPSYYSQSDGPFSVDSDGQVHLNTNPGGQTTPPIGYLSQNHEYMVIRHPTVWEPGVYDDIQIQTAMCIKQGGGLDDSSLSGTYHLRGMEAYDTSNTDRSASTYWGDIVFDGSGNWTLSGASVLNSDGDLEENISDSGTYAVSGNGGLTFTPASSANVRYGQLSSDGNVMFISAGFETIDGYEHNGLLVFVKTSGRTFSNVDLNGEYYFVNLEVDDFEEINGARDGHVSWGVISFNGAGSFTFEWNVTDADNNSDQQPGSGTYSVAANGDIDFHVTQVGGQSVDSLSKGHISDDGQFAVFTYHGTGSQQGNGGGGGGGGCFISSF